MKRILSFLLAILMVMFALPTAEVKADSEWTNPPTISATNELVGSNKVRLTVYINNAVQLTGTDFQINYPDFLTYESGTFDNPLWKQYDYDTESLVPIDQFEVHEDGHYVKYVAYDPSGKQNRNISSKSAIFHLDFIIKENAEGKCDFTLNTFNFDSTINGDKKTSNKNKGTETSTTPDTPIFIPTTSLAVTNLEAPVKGETADTSVDTDKTGVTGSVSWNPALVNGKFAADTAYTATITVDGGQNFRFADTVNVTLGQEQLQATSSNNVLTISKTFPKTEAKVLSSLEVDPSTVSVVAKSSSVDDVLSKVTITANYDDGSSETVSDKSKVNTDFSSVNFNAKGNYSGTVSYPKTETGSKTAQIRVTVTGKTATANYSGGSSLVYNGTDQSNNIKGNTQVEGTDEEHGDVTYTFKKGDSTVSSVEEVGTYVLFFRVAGGTVYNASEDVQVATIKITPKDLTNSGTATADPSQYTYDGTTHEPNVTVKDGDTTLNKDQDYNVTYDKNKDAGIGEAIINFINNFTGSIKAFFNIGKKTVDLNDLATVSAPSKTYDGTTDVYPTLTEIAVTTAATGAIKVVGTAAYDSAEAGANKTVTFTATGIEGTGSANYQIPDGFAVTIANAVINKATATNQTIGTQSVGKGSGVFAAPKIIGIDGTTPVTTGTITYTYQQGEGQKESKSYDEIVAALSSSSLSTGDTATIEYTFSDSNYNDVIGTINVTIVDVQFVVNEGAITTKANPTYGDKWNDIVTIDPSKITATLAGEPLSGTYSVVDGDNYPAAGQQNYNIVFTTDTGAVYTVQEATGSVTVAQKVITSTDLATLTSQTKVYDGTKDATGTELSVTGGLVGTDVITATGTTSYDSKDAGARTLTFRATGLSGTAATNYDLDTAGVTATATGTINPFVLDNAATYLVTPTGVVKDYDRNAETTVTSTAAQGLFGQDTATASGAKALLTDVNAGTRTARLTVTSLDNPNYALPTGGLTIEFPVTVNKINATKSVVDTQQVPVHVGTFTAPTFTGLNGTSLTQTIKYKLSGESEYTKDYDDIVNTLKGLTVGYSESFDYQFTNQNYNTITGTITATAVDVIFEVQSGAVTTKTNPTYGDTWSDIVTKIYSSKIQATIAGQPVAGTYSVTDSNVTPGAGDNTPFTVTFTRTSDGQTFTVSHPSWTVNVAKRKITSSNLKRLDPEEKTYDGTTDATATLVQITNKVGNDDIAVTGTTVYNNKDAGNKTLTFTASDLSGTAAGNYELVKPATTAGTGTIKKIELDENDFTAPSAISDRKYDGSTTVKDVKSATASSTKIVSGETVKGTGNEAVLDNPDAGNRTATLTLTSLDNKNYSLKNGSVALTFDVTVTPADTAIASEGEQETPYKDGDFKEPTVKGVDGNTVNGEVKYKIGNEEDLSYDQAKNKLSQAAKTGEGTPISVGFRFVSNDPNYNSTTYSSNNKINVTVAPWKVIDAEWTLGGSGTLTITCTGKFGEFTKDGFRIDDKEVQGVTFEEGSTKAILPASYLNSLSVGTHTVKFPYGTEIVEGKLTVKNKPSPSDDSKKSSSKSSSASGVVTCQDAGFPKDYAWNEAAKACQPGYLDANGVFHSTANNRRRVVNTNDTFSAFGWIISFTVATFAAVASVVALNKWK